MHVSTFTELIIDLKKRKKGGRKTLNNGYPEGWNVGSGKNMGRTGHSSERRGFLITA